MNKLILFFALCFSSISSYAKTCLYEKGNSLAQREQCLIKRISVGSQFFIDKIRMGKRVIKLHAAQLTSYVTGYEVAFIEENGHKINAKYAILDDKLNLSNGSMKNGFVL
ncbi:hypothetical protein [Mannheimia massilioguelmaensis]|uniref:hypothetical protein n=1 Tax=Mannheimia massilioguelmaensis TaxID=1604354 RepID=UPI0005C8603E|nr:hypothetical protein [Mannheimia massilioguelmaensis]